MTTHPLILASASPRRRDLLAHIGITPAQIIPANIDETPHKDEQPEAYVSRVAQEKAAAIAAQYSDHLILAADTIVAMGRRILPKAEDEATARNCLEKLSGRKHRVYSAIHLIHPDGHKWQKRVMTQVTFKRLTVTDIDWYLSTEEWDGKAGGYAIQGAAQAFIPRVNGSVSNVVGLPLVETRNLLNSAK